MSGTTQRSVVLIVHEDEDDVGFLLGGEQRRNLEAEKDRDERGQWFVHGRDASYKCNTRGESPQPAGGKKLA